MNPSNSYMRARRIQQQLLGNPTTADAGIVCNNWIGGREVPPVSGKYLEVQNPSDGSIIGQVALSGPADIAAAVKSAEEAFETWGSMPVKTRTQVLFKLHAILRDNTDVLADFIVLEHGKTKAEAIGDVVKGNETMEYACSMPQLIPGRVLPVSTGVECKEFRIPKGVVASIAPFNFPAMVPLWTIPIAIATGNCIIVKPSEKVPLTLCKMVKLFKEAGLPDGVINIVNGAVDCVNGICDNPDIKAVTFVGSTKVAGLVYERCAKLQKSCRALGGAKNYLVALPDCNVDMTAHDIVRSFSGCAGQRCMAASVLLTVGEQSELLRAVVEKASKLQPSVKNVPANTPTMGPVIDQTAVDRISRYIDLAEKNGARILLDGRSWTKAQSSGYWIGPTVILHTNSDDVHLQEEIFGPVISVLVVKNKEEAIALENRVKYGNAACIYTSVGQHAEWFSQRFSAAMVGVNIGVPVPREPFSFGGMNKSKFGDGDITGDGGIEFFTERKKVTSKWTPPPTSASSWMS